MQRSLLFVSVLTFAHAGTVAGAPILWDDSHDSDSDELTGNYAIFATTIVGAGHQIAELDGAPGAITRTALTGFNAFVLIDPELALTAPEISALWNSSPCRDD